MKKFRATSDPVSVYAEGTYLKQTENSQLGTGKRKWGLGTLTHLTKQGTRQ